MRSALSFGLNFEAFNKFKYLLLTNIIDTESSDVPQVPLMGTTTKLYVIYYGLSIIKMMTHVLKHISKEIITHKLVS